MLPGVDAFQMCYVETFWTQTLNTVVSAPLKIYEVVQELAAFVLGLVLVGGSFIPMPRLTNWCPPTVALFDGLIAVAIGLVVYVLLLWAIMGEKSDDDDDDDDEESDGFEDEVKSIVDKAGNMATKKLEGVVERNSEKIQQKSTHWGRNSNWSLSSNKKQSQGSQLLDDLTNHEQELTYKTQTKRSKTLEEQTNQEVKEQLQSLTERTSQQGEGSKLISQQGE